MTKTNDPVRVKNAWLRFGAAVLAAVILLAVSGFGIFSLLQGGKTFHTAEDLQVGDYVQDQVDLILANFAEGYHGNTVRELSPAVVCV